MQDRFFLPTGKKSFLLSKLGEIFRVSHFTCKRTTVRKFIVSKSQSARGKRNPGKNSDKKY